MEKINNLVISTSGLTKSYGGRPILKSLDLKVPEHSIFGFLGPNGAGKTTAIKLILGLTSSTSGTCTIFGKDIAKEGVDIRRRTGYLAQDPRFYEYKTARETLRFVARFFYDGPKEEIEFRIDETLELVGISDKADRPIRAFSGGERQRLGIAQAYINHPELLILDEPAAALDPMGRRDVLELMDKLRDKTTIFYSTHILDDVQRVSDIVAILDRGELKAQASINDLLAEKGNASYKLVLKGDAEKVRQMLAQHPWISLVDSASSNGTTSLLVTVTDSAKADNNLLKIALSVENVEVIDFGRKTQNLEEVFMGIVGEKANA